LSDQLLPENVGTSCRIHVGIRGVQEHASTTTRTISFDRDHYNGSAYNRYIAQERFERSSSCRDLAWRDGIG
jgi:hypothetical protein